MTDYENKEDYLRFIAKEPGEPGQILKWDGRQYRWVNPDKHLSELKSEFGCSGNVRWLSEAEVTAYDTEGNVIKCKCGKKASASLIGTTHQAHYCQKCLYGDKNER